MTNENLSRFPTDPGQEALGSRQEPQEFFPTSGTLLSSEDPPTVRIANIDGRTPLVLICDHASRAVPERLQRLGLEDHVFEFHIAYDIGAADVTKIMAETLGAPAVFAGYSRLVIDCNRQPGDPFSIPEVSDRIKVPGNIDLSEEEMNERENLLFRPYHRAAGKTVTRLWRKTGKPPAVFSIHSFTPHFNGENRPWDAGVLWNRDPRIAVPLVNHLREHEHLFIGDNEPYSGREIAYSIDLHAGAAGLPNAAIEIRQDLLETEEGIRYWAKVMSDALEKILAQDDLHQVEHF